jgi:RimJ/RimL family protein N-acetyltransferase
MIHLVLGNDETVVPWVESRLPYNPRIPRPCASIGIMNDETLIAGAVYHGFRAHEKNGRRASSIEISLCADDKGWGQRWVIQALLRYPFNQLECTRLNAMIRRKNKMWREKLKWLGFKEEGILRHWYADDDAVIYGLLRDDATRWTGEKT